MAASNYSTLLYAAPIVAMLAGMAPETRARAINELITHLDAFDAVTEDLEDEPLEDDDPAGAVEVLAALPQYGDDQTNGPINFAQANREHLGRLWGAAA